MARERLVTIKGRKNGLSIWLDERADFEQIRTKLQEKVAEAKHFFADAQTNIMFRGRSLSDAERQALMNTIAAESTMALNFVEQDQTEKKPDDAFTAPAPLSPPGMQFTEYQTAFYQSGLRSGQSIRYAGSVVVVGDANPGSEIIAHGNVVVLGAVKGLVHAGAAGDTECFVSALTLTPTQLRIADVITYLPAAPSPTAKPARRPSYAYLQNGQVYIAPLLD